MQNQEKVLFSPNNIWALFYRITMQTMYLENYLAFVHRADLQIMFLRWLTAVNSAQLRHGYEEALRKALEFEVRYWLFDLRGRGPASEEDEAWLMNNYFPRADKQFEQPNYFAYLISPSHQKQALLFDKVKKVSAGNCRIQVFTAEQEALKWLQDLQFVG